MSPEHQRCDETRFSTGRGTGDTSTDHRVSQALWRRAEGGLEGLRGCPCSPGDGWGRTGILAQSRGSLKVVTGSWSPGSVALAGQKVFLENFAFRAQRGKRAGEQRREEVGAQSQACCWLAGGGAGEVAVVGRRTEAENRGTRAREGMGHWPLRTGLSSGEPLAD